MSVYAISDLHLALGINKPMDIFGERWSNYMSRLKASWKEYVAKDDTVIIPGDISWATYLEQALEDFRFIEELPGRKIILKGNHDYWWTTANKLEKFLERNNFLSIEFMHNNSYKLGKIILCGTRGWKCPGDDDFSQEDRKIYNRELQRLELSLKAGEKHGTGEIVTALHYPPLSPGKDSSGFVEIMQRFGVKTCIYGHLHGDGFKNAVSGMIGGIEYRLVSADYLEFVPVKMAD